MKLYRTVPGQGIYHREEDLTPGNEKESRERGLICVYDEVKYQSILGFGGAFTESSAYNYSLLTDAQKQEYMEAHFGTDGLNYNFGRTHIASCDFSLDIYSHVESGDSDLSTFSLDRDRKYIIPFIRDAQKYTGTQLMLFASPWSPPAYMKDNESAIKGGCLKEEYKALWAAYYCRYIQEMEKEGIEIFAVSVQNEPKAVQTWESCSYSAAQEAEFIEKYLAPALDANGLSHIKIIIWDHNKERVYERARDTMQSPVVRERVWAVGHHWYSGDHFEGLRLVHEQFGKTLISTEICSVINEDVNEAAERYGIELCEDFNNFTAAFCDWNMLLDEKATSLPRNWPMAASLRISPEAAMRLCCITPIQRLWNIRPFTTTSSTFPSLCSGARSVWLPPTTTAVCTAVLSKTPMDPWCWWWSILPMSGCRPSFAGTANVPAQPWNPTASLRCFCKIEEEYHVYWRGSWQHQYQSCHLR